MNVLTVGEASAPRKTLRVKPAPEKLPVTFSYSPSVDGTDENLLILLHGLGDTEAPFANLGKQLRLPQTATLSLRAPQRIPYLYEDAFQWYEAFDHLGELLTHPNPTPALDVIDRVLDHLMTTCKWPLDRIHLFGFGQGGSVVAEWTLRKWQRDPHETFGSVASVEGPLVSFPTLKPPCATRVLYFRHVNASSATDDAAYRKGFSSVNEVRMPGQEGMPRGKNEWAEVIKFWSGVLAQRELDMEGMHPVLSGGPAM